MSNQLALTNVINISVSQAQSGIGEYNTSNLGLFTGETAGGGFGSDGYKIYLSPQDVGVDFGTSSQTYAMANAVFSQKPNILAGNGYLAVIPFEASHPAVIAQQLITFSIVPTSGSYKLTYGVSETGAIAYNDNAAAVQVALRLLSGLSSVTVTGDYTSGFTVVFTGVSGPATLLTNTSNSLQGAGSEDSFLTIATTVVGVAAGSQESLAAAISRTADLVQYFGVISAQIESQSDMLAAAAVIQPLNKIGFFVQRASASIEVGGSLDLLRSGNFSQSRGLYYGANNDSDAINMAAAYAGRGLSVNFNGSNTTITMHLKDLIGIQPDPSMTQTLLTKAQAAGADCYVSLQGVSKVFCSGENSFFDQVYNLQWLVGALQVAGFNYLAQSSSKIPQTESGIDGLKGAYRKVCEQAVTNQYCAPGEWNSSTTFGIQSDFLQNITQRGYYIYSQPVALQSQAAREARQAPIIQLAIKEAGSVHSSSVLVYINA